MKRSSCLAIFIAFALPTFSSWAGVPVAIDQLPTPVIETLKKSFAESRILSAESKTRNDYVYYFVKIRQGKRTQAVTINEYGAISGATNPSRKSAPK